MALLASSDVGIRWRTLLSRNDSVGASQSWPRRLVAKGVRDAFVARKQSAHEGFQRDAGDVGVAFNFLRRGRRSYAASSIPFQLNRSN